MCHENKTLPKEKKKKVKKKRSKWRVILQIAKGWFAVLQRLSEALPKGNTFFIKEITF